LKLRDIDQIIKLMRDRSSSVTVEQLQCRHPTDDDGIWFFNQPDSSFEVQLESSTGMCPFLVETDESDVRITTQSVSEAVEAVTELLHL
jgi:hypothetical protein